MATDATLTIDVIRDAMGDDAAEFIKVMDLVQQMIQSPEDFYGPKAVIEATRLAALRTKISMKGQYYKQLKEGNPAIIRQRKDVLLAMYAALEENINCLKLMGRLDAASAGIVR